MITLLPYPDFKQSARVLDDVRLQNQVLEAKAILDAVGTATNQPAVRMWRGAYYLLAEYGAEMALEWGRRYNKRHAYLQHFYDVLVDRVPEAKPSWLGKDQLHASHRARLREKDHVFYKLFTDKVGIFCCPGCAYWWPSHRSPA